jgi:hypothetical protein
MKPEILVIATHPDILKTILRLLNNHEDWSGTGVSTIAEAIETFPTKDFNVVLLGAGMAAAADCCMRKYCRRWHNNNTRSPLASDLYTLISIYSHQLAPFAFKKSSTALLNLTGFSDGSSCVPLGNMTNCE